MIEDVIVTRQININTTSQQRQQLFGEHWVVAVFAVRINRMMCVNDLPLRGTLLQFSVKPRELRVRYFICVEREELNGPAVNV